MGAPQSTWAEVYVPPPLKVPVDTSLAFLPPSLALSPCLFCPWPPYPSLPDRMLFRNPMSALNVTGCAITLLGCTLYGYVRQVCHPAGMHAVWLRQTGMRSGGQFKEQVVLFTPLAL